MINPRLGLLAACLAMSACTGLTQMQDSLNKFGEGATSVSSTEMTFFNNVQSLDCSVQFYSASADWAVGAAGTYDLSGHCILDLPRFGGQFLVFSL